MRNRVKFFKLDDLFKYGVFFSFAVGVGWAEFAFFFRFFELLQRVPGGIYLVTPRLFSLLGSFLFAFLSYSSILTALSSIYRSDDVRLLMVAPISHTIMLFHKFTDVTIRSGTTVVLLALPPMLAIGLTIHPNVFFYPAYVFALLSITISATCIGTVFAMTLMMFFPEKRLHQSLAIIGLCIAALLITGLRFLHLENLWGNQPLESPVMLYLSDEQSSVLTYSPGTLFSETVLRYLWNQEGASLWLVGSLVWGISILFLSLWLGSKLFFRSWNKSQEQCDPEIRNRWNRYRTIAKILPFSQSFNAFIMKDWLLMKRDPSIWTQLFMMVPLAGIYLFNLTFLPLETEEFKRFFAIANVGLIGLIVAAVSARFLFPAASREGKSVWIPVTSPISTTTFLFQKLLFSTPPIILLSIVLLYASCWILRVPEELYSWSLWYGTALSIFLCVQSILLGFCFPTFEYRNLIEVSLGVGSFLYMILAMAEIATLNFLALRAMFTSIDRTVSLYDYPTMIWLLLLVMITLACFWYGKRKFQRIEL